MKTKPIELFSLAILTLFYILAFSPNQTPAAAPPQIEVIIKVTYNGFFDADGHPLNNLIKVPKERNIKLTFEHAGKPGEKHAFVLLFDSDEEIESGTISDQNRRTHIEFTTGKTGETYDVFCVIVDCDGMEHLTDLVIIAT